MYKNISYPILYSKRVNNDELHVYLHGNFAHIKSFVFVQYTYVIQYTLANPAL